MNNLRQLLEIPAEEPPAARLDSFQSGVLTSLHLEFFFDESRFLISPAGRMITIGKPRPEEEDRVLELLESGKVQLTRVRKWIGYHLALHSALLESNSYTIASNQNLIIVRFVPMEKKTDHFEVKLYTIHPDDLPANYKDKLYLGRDFLALTVADKAHFGLGFFRDSLAEQYQKMRERVQLYAPESERKELEKEYMGEIQELITDFSRASSALQKSLPANIASTLPPAELAKAGEQFRELKHILIEVQESVREMERRLNEGDFSRPARYVTKFKKDVNNIIHYILLRINARITDALNAG